MTDLLIVSSYITTVLVVGIYYSRNIKSMRDFSSSNKTFSSPIIMATISATYIGGEFLFGIAEKSSLVGTIFFFSLLGTCLGKLFIAYAVVPRLSKYSSSISVGEIMQENYGKVGRVITGLAASILCIGYVGAQIGACASLFQYFFDISQLLGILIACGIVVIYSAFGGFKAVTLTDVVQFAVLIVAVPIIASYSLNQIGGYDALFHLLPKNHVLPTFDAFVDHIAWFMVFFVPFLDPALMQRMTMDRDAKKVAAAWRLSALVDIPLYLVICTIGAIALVSIPDLKATDAFLTVMSNLPKGFIGLAVAGVLAVVMSTADSYLNVASISLVHDVIKPLWRVNISDKVELRLARLMTLFLGAAAIIASIKIQSLLDMIVSFMNFSWVPLIVAPLYAKIFGYKIGVKPFIIACICGICSQFIWPLLGFNSQILALMMSPFVGGLGLWLSHRIFEGRWPARTPPVLPLGEKKLPRRQRRLRFLWQSNLVKCLISTSSKRVESFGASYTLFGVFAVLNYMVPYFMWSSTHSPNFNLHLGLRFLAGILSFGLIMHDYWPSSVQRYIPLYWHLTLLYCLPFLSTFMLLDNGTATFWLYNIVLALFLLAALVDWVSFVILLLVGSSFAYGLFRFLRNDILTPFDSENIYLLIYLYVFAAFIGVIFSRRKEKILQEKLQTLKTMSASIAHEMRTPLATIAIGASNLQKYIPLYNEVYQKAEDAGLIVPQIGRSERLLLGDIPATMEVVSNNAQNIINMLLIKTKEISEQASDNNSTVSIAQCIENALNQYPLKSGERQYIFWDNAKDFLFIGKEEIVIHILFNLLKNSLHQMMFIEKGKIDIWLELTAKRNYLHFKDNGPGVPKHILLNIFNRFVSDTEFGTGMGLAYCKMAMNTLGGNIECISQEGQGAEFVLSFPALSRKAIAAMSQQSA